MSKQQIEKVKAAALVLDYSLYPRHQVSDEHIRHLQDVVEAGHQLPPVIADRKSLRVTDGFNRITRALRYEGNEALIDIAWKDYADEREMILDAFRLNAEHGLRFTSYDIARCITLAEQFHIEAVDIAGALHLTVDRLDKIRLHKTAIGPGNRLVPIKRTLGHLAGERVTKGQLEAQKRAVGHHQIFLVNQIINLIEGGILDEGDSNLAERLEHLAGLLKPWLGRKKKSA